MPIVLEVTGPGPVPVAAMPPSGPVHFSFPFAFQANFDGSINAATVEQDTLGEIYACVQAIVACPIGFRDELPPFGIPSVEFAQAPINAINLQRSIAIWEPRADSTATEYADLTSDAWRHVQLGVTTATPSTEDGPSPAGINAPVEPPGKPPYGVGPYGGGPYGG